MNVNWDEINHDSVVVVTVSEYRLDPDNPEHSTRFVGDASITVSNVRPHSPPYDPNLGVTFVVEIDWPEPLAICTDIVVLEPVVDVQGAADAEAEFLRDFGYGVLVDDPIYASWGSPGRTSRARWTGRPIIRGRCRRWASTTNTRATAS